MRALIRELCADTLMAAQVEEEWLAHEAGVVALAPAHSRMISMAADGSIRAWSSAVGCPQEQLARCAEQCCSSPHSCAQSKAHSLPRWSAVEPTAAHSDWAGHVPSEYVFGYHQACHMHTRVRTLNRRGLVTGTHE